MCWLKPGENCGVYAMEVSLEKLWYRAMGVCNAVYLVGFNQPLALSIHLLLSSLFEVPSSCRGNVGKQGI
jgi:hypothetical protein